MRSLSPCRPFFAVAAIAVLFYIFITAPIHVTAALAPIVNTPGGNSTANGDAFINLEKTVGTDPHSCATTGTITVITGTLVTYCYEITNNVGATLTRHTLEDNQLGILLNNEVITVAPNATFFITESAVITTTTTNVASWSAKVPEYEVNVIPDSFFNIGETGTYYNLTDDGEVNVTLPFTFTLFDTPSTAIRIGNNGGVLFNTTSGDLSFANIPLPAGSDRIGGSGAAILPFWDDMYTDPNSALNAGVYTEIIGNAPTRQFIIQWHNLLHHDTQSNPNNVLRYQLKLFEGSNIIEFHYDDIYVDNGGIDRGASATVGLQESYSNAQLYSFNQAVLEEATALQWVRSIEGGNTFEDFDGATVVIGIPSSTPSNTPTPSNTSTPTATATATATPVPPSATATPTSTFIPPTATATATMTAVPATNTATPTGTLVPPTITATPTGTLVPPTITPTATATAIPPTVTPTPTGTEIPATVTPTSTGTTVPSTHTPTPTGLPSTVTPTPTATPTIPTLERNVFLPLIGK
jgi:hypothetical protein